jgi:quercetin dioxygenase-like cupin family protein
MLLVAGMAAQTTSAQEAGKSTYVAGATSKFINFPGIPGCAQGAVQKGDPFKGDAVLLLKVKPGCVIPWHWHTPVESLMMVSGRAKVEMKDGSPAALRAGDFLDLPSKHIHQFTCLAACLLFDVSTGAPFDIHYVDSSGNEIPADQVLKAKAKAPAKKTE